VKNPEVLGVRKILYAAAITAVLVASAGISAAQRFAEEDIWTAEKARVEALPSWFGETGLVVIPTAQTVHPQRIEAHFHRVDRDAGGENAWGANIGLTSNIEAGVTRLDEISETVFQAKLNLDIGDWLTLRGMPQVAIGARDIGDVVDRALYVVLSSALTIKEEEEAVLSAHLGFGDTTLPGSPLDGIFGGVDFTPFEFLRVQVEHDGENLNAAARYWWSDWLCTDVGSLDGDFGWGVVAETRF